MKQVVSFLLVAFTAVQGFTTPKLAPSWVKKSALAASIAEATNAFEQGPKIVRDQLPILYVYDHCPFCVRVRLALGVKNIKYLVQFLANDDISTPTKLIGKKISPIFVSKKYSKSYIIFSSKDFSAYFFMIIF